MLRVVDARSLLDIADRFGPRLRAAKVRPRRDRHAFTSAVTGLPATNGSVAPPSVAPHAEARAVVLPHRATTAPLRVGGTYAAIHWTGFDGDQKAVGAGFLLRIDGASPLGASDTPEIVRLLDGGSEPFEATARHLLTAEEAGWLVGRLGRGERPTRWPAGRPLVWSAARVGVTHRERSRTGRSGRDSGGRPHPA